jgi:hypothetical protein
MWLDGERKIVARVIASVVGGILFFALATMAMSAVSKELWPEYAAAVADGAYTLPMLWSRLVSGAAAIIFATWLAVMLGKQNLKTGFLIGVSLLVLNILWHVNIWDKYPVWYHLTWFAIIMPSALLGGRLARR